MPPARFPRGFAVAAVILALGLVGVRAHADCDFEHPKTAKQFRSNLVQAFVTCGGFANTTTEGGVPSCAPPETWNELGGSPPGGWMWDESKGRGEIRLKAAKNKVTGLSNVDPSDVADVEISAALSGVTENFVFADGDGTVTLVVRMTWKDHVGGDMTTIDFPGARTITLVGGKGKMKSSFNALMAQLMQPGLPRCTSVELLYAAVRDPNGSTFAAAGIYLPDIN